jgi:glycosyltransferase involved in cell wall biosynthesis
LAEIINLELSIVIPIYNEEENIDNLMEEIENSIPDLQFEVIFVNDGSTDASLQLLEDLERKYKSNNRINIVVADLRRNSGQTAAMRAGFSLVSGRYVITMDGDGQNDPNDIPKLYQRISTEKVDVICGWRKDRHDPISKKIPSKISNFLHRRLTGLNIHDSGCTLRIYVADAVKELPIHGEDHRFLPAIIYSKGYKVEEMIVNHRHRTAGESKYGFSRLWRGYLDLLSTTFVIKTGVKPFQFYSKVALFPFTLGTIILLYLTSLKFFNGESIGDRPLLLLGILLEIFAVQFFVTGLTAEVVSTEKATSEKRYSIRTVTRN